MPKKKIVITGAEGFIATNLILKLSKNYDFDLVGIDSSKTDLGIATADWCKLYKA